MIMKYIYRLLFIFLCSCSLVGCDEGDFLEIESLSTDGDEFYCNQKVKVWMCVRSSDLWHTDYEWSCDGGTLTQPQGLNEMTWKAPSAPGTYTITCRATVGGETQVRSHKMNVTTYYFDKFEKTPYSLSLQDNKAVTATLKKESESNQYLQVKINSSGEVNRYVRRSFDDKTLYTPFSTRMKLGFESNVPDMDSITVGKKKGQPTLEYRWNMRSDASNNNAYVNQVRLSWYPGKLKNGFSYPKVVDTDGLGGITETVEGTEDYNLRIMVEYIATDGKKSSYTEYHMMNTMNTFVPKLYQTVSMSVDENESILIYLAGEEVLKSNLLKNVRTLNACEGRISIDNWEIYLPNGNAGKNVPVIYVDDAYASNLEMLK